MGCTHPRGGPARRSGPQLPSDCEHHETKEKWYPRHRFDRPLAPPNRDACAGVAEAKCYLEWGKALLKTKERELGLAKLDEALKISSRSIGTGVDRQLAGELAYLRASALLEKEEFQQAQAEFQRVATAFPDGPNRLRARFMAAVCVEKGEKPEECFELYENLIEGHRDSGVGPDRLLPADRDRAAGQRGVEPGADAGGHGAVSLKLPFPSFFAICHITRVIGALMLFA